MSLHYLVNYNFKVRSHEMFNHFGVLAHPISIFSDAHFGALRGDASWKFHKWYCRGDHRFLTHTLSRIGLLWAQQFLATKIRKLAKKFVYFGLYRSGL